MIEEFYSFNNKITDVENTNNHSPSKSYALKSNNLNETPNLLIQNVQTYKILDKQVLNLDDGNQYRGQTLNGKKNGKGILTDPDMYILYEGEWKNDLYHGEGKLFENKFVYNGMFMQGKKEGKGRLSSDDNDNYYSGNWKDDDKNGDGNQIINF